MGEKVTRRVGVRAGYDLLAASYEATPNPVVAMDGRVATAPLRPKAVERAGFRDMRTSTYRGDKDLARMLPKAAGLVGRKVILA